MVLGPILFLNPLMLLSLLTLPMLWWLLKVIPPKPVRVRFPAIGLLMGLSNREQSASSSPWWLVLLRMAMIAFLILAVSKPVLDPDAALPGQGPIVIIVDDGWQSAAGWRQKSKSLGSIVELAGRSNRGIIVQTTAPDYDASPPSYSGLMDAARARIYLERLTPKPWDVNYTQALRGLSELDLDSRTAVFWASDGVENPGSNELAARLTQLGKLTIFSPQANAQPMLITIADKKSDRLSVDISRSDGAKTLGITVVAQDEEGSILARSNAVFAAGKTQTTAEFNLPVELRNQIVRISLEDRPGIGGVVLLDDRWQRRPVGIVRESMADQGLMLLAENYYLERALKPLGSLSQAPVKILLKAGQSVILLPDTAPISADDRKSLKDWISDGGVLVRFAGDNLANSLDDDLVPVRLRQGGRSLGGAMLWAKPQKLASFDDKSPFAGLTIPDDAYVLRQVLADPSPELHDKTWARLVDDTPLVTASKRGSGWVVLFHSTANAEWSNIALSGLFVNMLERLVSLSEGTGLDGLTNQSLPPLQLYDGFGAVMAPGAAAISITGPLDETFAIGPTHPPGFYGNKIFKRAFNLVNYVDQPKLLSDIPASATHIDYQDSKALSLAGWLLGMALFLLSIDTLVTLKLRGQLLRPLATNTVQVVLVAIVFSFGNVPSKGHAQNSANDYYALQASMGTVLAYIKTGEDHIDQSSFAGLAGLSLILNQRTAVEAGQPMAVNPAKDELAFFPLIYWPISEAQTPFSDFAIEQLNDYLANGGTLLIDTRDRQLGNLGTMGTSHLRRLAAGLSVPALEQLPPGHVLSKSFYLLKEFPGRWRGNSLWVEAPGSKVNDGVSSIVVGGNDWAGAWAVDDGGRPLYPIIPGGDEQREMAYRFGVNLVMYTLTGNYKADQVHVPAILERLGQ